MSTVVSDRQTYTSPQEAPPREAARPLATVRIASLDIIRGAVMVLMAIDHVRVYSGQPAGGPTPGIFFTRWVTHFCAPAFVFLAGTAAYLFGQKRRSAATDSHASKRQLAGWLLSRGAWLVLLELTVLRFAWTFNFHYTQSAMAGVIWCIGWCMILLAGLIYLPMPVLAAFGILIVFGHNLVDAHLEQAGAMLEKSQWAWFWQVLYFGGVIQHGEMTFGVLYSIVPWVAVMALGYAFGPILRMEPSRRARICFAIGGAAVAVFLVLRGFNIYGDPRPWITPPQPAVTTQLSAAPSTASPQSSAAAPAPRPRAPAVLRFLNTTKYPASLLFLLMTLGPMLIAIPLLELAQGRVAAVLTTFGRVPFFYYVLHIPLIHLAALVASIVMFGRISPWLFTNHPMLSPPPPDGYTWGLSTLYLVWALVMIPLYFACRWYAGVKAKSRNPLLSYL
jgi:uncharacterized membrane protein